MHHITPLAYPLPSFGVNAANNNLLHEAGIARAIVQAGGESIQTESDELVLYYQYYYSFLSIIIIMVFNR